MPGLSIRRRDGALLDAPAVPGAFVVNGGQLLLRWTNDLFLATPHRGSQLADSWVGRLAGRLIRLPTELQRELFTLAKQNREVTTAEANAFQTELNYSAVHTLSPRDPVLRT